MNSIFAFAHGLFMTFINLVIVEFYLLWLCRMQDHVIILQDGEFRSCKGNGQCMFSPSDIWFYGTKEKRTITSIQMIFLTLGKGVKLSRTLNFSFLGKEKQRLVSVLLFCSY